MWLDSTSFIQQSPEVTEWRAEEGSGERNEPAPVKWPRAGIRGTLDDVHDSVPDRVERQVDY